MNRIQAFLLAAAIVALPLGSAAAQDKADSVRRGPGRAAMPGRPGMMMGRGMAPDMAGRVLSLRSELNLTDRQVERLTAIQKEYAAKNDEAISRLRSAQDKEIQKRRDRQDEVRKMTVEERQKVIEQRREELEERRDDRREATEKAREERREEMEKVREERMKEFAKAHPELAKAQREVMKTNQDAAKEIRDVLTDEQEKKLEERMQARRGEMRENLRERRPGRAAPGRPRQI